MSKNYGSARHDRNKGFIALVEATDAMLKAAKRAVCWLGQSWFWPRFRFRDWRCRRREGATDAGATAAGRIGVKWSACK